MSIIKDKITDQNYNDIVMKDENPFVLVFVSRNCPHCRTVERFMKTIEKDYENIDIFHLEGEKSPKLIKKFGVMSFPTTQFINSKKIGVGRVVGAGNAKNFLSLFDKINPRKKKNFFQRLFKGK